MAAVGGAYSGIFCNQERLYKDLTAAGEATGERLWRLRVGDLVRGPAEGGELPAPAVAHEAAELEVDVVGEVLERRRGAPLLALEQHRHERGAQHEGGGDVEPPGAEQGRGALAGGPVADLVVVLEVAEQAVGGDAGQGPAVAAAPVGGVAAGVDVAPLQRPAERLEAAEVLVVAGGLTGQGAVEGVVKVVAPGRIHAVAAGVGGADQLRVVEVALGDEELPPPEAGLEGGDPPGQILEDVDGRRVEDGVHGVEPQAVDVVVLEPLRGVLDDELAHGAAVVTVEVECVAPRRAMPVGRVRTEEGEVIARGSEVVVHDVEDHAETARVRGVDEFLEPFRSSVRLVDRVQRDAVVAPSELAVERGDRHHLDRRDAERDERVEFLDRARERARRRERADVELVDDGRREIEPRP